MLLVWVSSRCTVLVLLLHLWLFLPSLLCWLLLFLFSLSWGFVGNSLQGLCSFQPFSGHQLFLWVPIPRLHPNIFFTPRFHPSTAMPPRISPCYKLLVLDLLYLSPQMSWFPNSPLWLSWCSPSIWDGTWHTAGSQWTLTGLIPLVLKPPRSLGHLPFPSFPRPTSPPDSPGFTKYFLHLSLPFESHDFHPTRDLYHLIPRHLQQPSPGSSSPRYQSPPPSKYHLHFILQQDFLGLCHC